MLPQPSIHVLPLAPASIPVFTTPCTPIKCTGSVIILTGSITICPPPPIKAPDPNDPEIPITKITRALKSLSNLLDIIYAGNFDKLTKEIEIEDK